MPHGRTEPSVMRFANYWKRINLASSQKTHNRDVFTPGVSRVHVDYFFLLIKFYISAVSCEFILFERVAAVWLKNDVKE